MVIGEHSADVRARDHDHDLAFGMSLHGFGAGPRRSQLVGRAGGDHAEAAVVVDVPRAERHARELAEQYVFSVVSEAPP